MVGGKVDFGKFNFEINKMNRNNLILIAVIGGIILLGIGFYSGLIYTQKQIESPLAQLLTSKVIKSMDIVASGEIAEISGRNLTLTQEGNNLTISIREDSFISRLVPSEETTIETPKPVATEEIGFEEIKKGDKVEISCQLKSDGSLEGKVVTILP